MSEAPNGMPTLQEVIGVLLELEADVAKVLASSDGQRGPESSAKRPVPPRSSNEFAFVLMPFVAELEGVYAEAIKPAVESTGFACYRADDFFTANKIMDDIDEAISQADYIIADLTGRNPNVFYEVGMSHERKKRVILLTQTMEDVPFDLRSWRIIPYEDTPEGRDKLVRGLRRTIRTISAGG